MKTSYSIKVNAMMDNEPNVYNQKGLTLGTLGVLFRFIMANRIAHKISGEIIVINEQCLTIRKFTLTESGEMSMMVILRGVMS